MQRQSKEFHPQAAERLFVAVVNRAILDVLDNREEAEEAKQWLFSKDFENLRKTVRVRQGVVSAACAKPSSDCL